MLAFRRAFCCGDEKGEFSPFVRELKTAALCEFIQLPKYSFAAE
jgi:hypothetical protein